jgi:hypothetical protein
MILFNRDSYFKLEENKMGEIKMKITQERINLAAQLIKEGNFANVVAEAIGISERTWYNWMDQGEAIYNKYEDLLEEDEEAVKEELTERQWLYLQFFQSIKKATALAEIEVVSIIQAHAKKNWYAAAWYLERKNQDRWALKKDVQGGDGKEDAIDKLLKGVGAAMELSKQRNGGKEQ